VSSRNWLASVLVACSPMIGFLSITPAATAASTKQSVWKHDKSARSYELRSKRRVRSTKIHLPLGPSYIYYDYPYYYARGYYPTHIGGYIYYYPPYSYHRRYYRNAVARRSHRSRSK
jgi:hypothetical protein